MQEVGAIVYWVLLLVAWLAIPFGAPGALIMLALSLLYAWLTGFQEPAGHALIWIAAVTLPAEAADQLLGIWAARRYGAIENVAVDPLVQGRFGQPPGAMKSRYEVPAMAPLPRCTRVPRPSPIDARKRVGATSERVTELRHIRR